MNSNKWTYKGICIGLAVVALIFIGTIAGLIIHNNKSVTKEYSLNELDDGVYGIYSVVSSTVPAHNYEIITLCVGQEVCTFKGHVNIHYVDNQFRLVLKDSNTINADTMDVYVPVNSIEFSANVGIGNRR